MASLGARLLAEYVQPRTRALQASAVQLQADLQQYCALPADAARRLRVEQRLGETISAWAPVEILRFGPLVEENRLEHLFLWPDPRGTVQRQMRTLLTAADPQVLQPAQLRQQSAAVQGLPALEYALYADEAPRLITAGDAAGRYRCSFAVAVAGNVVQLAEAVARGWESNAPLAVEFARPAPDRNVYRSGPEVATEVVKALSTALHAMRDQKLQPALGDDLASARGTLLPLHRSGFTTRYLAAETAALADFYRISRLGAALPEESAWIDGAVRDELRRIDEDFAALAVPAATAVADAAHRDLLVHAALVLANARAVLDEYLAPALHIDIGFNALDGD